MKRALSASNAPGVEVLVAVFPSGDRYADEMVAIQKHGKPYVILKLPLLLEKLGEALDGDGSESLWLPSAGTVPAMRARAAARAVLDAVLSEQQGRVELAHGTRLEPRVLFEKAANAVGRDLRVHEVPPALHRAVRPVARWLRGSEPKALSLADRLLPPANRAAPPEPAQWPPFVFPPGDPLAILPWAWLEPGANDPRESGRINRASRQTPGHQAPSMQQTV